MGSLFMRLGSWLTGGWATMGFGFRPGSVIEAWAGHSCTLVASTRRTLIKPPESSPDNCQYLTARHECMHMLLRLFARCALGACSPSTKF